jgi:hypothetical protein
MQRHESASGRVVAFWVGATLGWWFGFAQGYDQGQIAGASRVLQSIARGMRTTATGR